MAARLRAELPADAWLEFDTGAGLLRRFCSEMRDFTALEASLREGKLKGAVEIVHFRRGNDVLGAAVSVLRTFLTMPPVYGPVPRRRVPLVRGRGGPAPRPPRLAGVPGAGDGRRADGSPRCRPRRRRGASSERWAGTRWPVRPAAGRWAPRCRAAAHAIDAEEAWHYVEGDPLELLIYHPAERRLERHRLGPLEQGAKPAQVVPAQAWQASRPLGAYTLVTCMVAPAFEFGGFRLLADEPFASTLRQQLA